MSEQDGGRMKHRLGMSRRDLLRRGAVVGGTLIWTIPVIKTVTTANAATSTVFSCCECRPGNNDEIKCGPSPASTACASGTTVDSVTLCQAFCNTQPQGKRAYCYKSGPSPFTCSGNNCTT